MNDEQQRTPTSLQFSIQPGSPLNVCFERLYTSSALLYDYNCFLKSALYPVSSYATQLLTLSTIHLLVLDQYTRPHLSIPLYLSCRTLLGPGTPVLPKSCTVFFSSPGILWSSYHTRRSHHYSIVHHIPQTTFQKVRNLYHDLCCSLKPLGDLPKHKPVTFNRQLSSFWATRTTTIHHTLKIRTIHLLSASIVFYKHTPDPLSNIICRF